VNRQQDLPETSPKNVPYVKSAIAGILMGIANLIPGFSGGTMILAMGLYDEFIGGVADVTAFRWKKRTFIFLGILGISALLSAVSLVNVIRALLDQHEAVMLSLFIGLTLGGAPLLARLLKPVRATTIIALVIAFTVMVGVAWLKYSVAPVHSEEAIVTATDQDAQQDVAVDQITTAATSSGLFPHNPPMDFVSGVVGSTTMVLPGISGSLMLLVMDQYDRVMGAINPPDLRIIAVAGLGGIVGVIGLSNILKWLIKRYSSATHGVLMGLLLGSPLCLWPFPPDGQEPTATRIVGCIVAGVAGFLVTLALSRYDQKKA
jgi:putative membrane protein